MSSLEWAKLRHVFVNITSSSQDRRSLPVLDCHTPFSHYFLAFSYSEITQYILAMEASYLPAEIQLCCAPLPLATCRVIYGCYLSFGLMIVLSISQAQLPMLGGNNVIPSFPSSPSVAMRVRHRQEIYYYNTSESFLLNSSFCV